VRPEPGCVNKFEVSEWKTLSTDCCARVLGSFVDSSPVYFFRAGKLQDVLDGSSLLELEACQIANTCCSTYCAALDDVLGGGVRCGEVTEMCTHPSFAESKIFIQDGSSFSSVCLQQSTYLKLSS
jgi:hypothetical protein